MAMMCCGINTKPVYTAMAATDIKRESDMGLKNSAFRSGLT